MAFFVENTSIDVVKIINLFHSSDLRGDFIKSFHHTDFKKSGIDFTLKESFFSISKKNVIRGMHFHSPPFEHDKIVFCTQGSILDVALDLRKNKNTYGQCVSQILSDTNHKALFIPKGFAHGFLALSEMATTFYFVSGEYHANADSGVRFDSFDFDWKVEKPILSPRDLQFESFKNLNSPF